MFVVSAFRQRRAVAPTKDTSHSPPSPSFQKIRTLRSKSPRVVSFAACVVLLLLFLFVILAPLRTRLSLLSGGSNHTSRPSSDAISSSIVTHLNESRAPPRRGVIRPQVPMLNSATFGRRGFMRFPEVYQLVLEQPNTSLCSYCRRALGGSNLPSVEAPPKQEPSAVPTQASEDSSSQEPIDSVIHVVLDAAEDEIQNGMLKEEVLVSAMAAVPNDVTGSYHTFFRDRRAAFFYEEGQNSRAEQAPDLTGSTTTRGSCANMKRTLQLDVVYTYVREDAPSHIHNREKYGPAQQSSKEESRFRDWNELFFSLRSVFQYGMNGHAQAEEMPLVRQVFIIVADVDQAPAWLNTSHPTIRLVTHAELFPQDELHQLPTFNSHAIESVMHRIPGLSRFFVYFNNDMLWGRRVSLFDYFRPISSLRQSFRRERLACNPASLDDEVGNGRDRSTTTTSNNKTTMRRVSIMFEPILYTEGFDGGGGCMVYPYPYCDANTTAAAGPWNTSSRSCLDRKILVEEIRRNDRQQLHAGRLLQLWCQYTEFPLERMVTTGEKWRKVVHYNRALVFSRMGGLWPTHNFAHIPRLIDRRILERMEDVDFYDVAKLTRASRGRSTYNFWTTHLIGYYSLYHRKQVDDRLVVIKSSWQFPNESAVLSRLRDIQDSKERATPVKALIDFLRPDDHNDLVNGEFTLSSMRYVKDKNQFPVAISSPMSAAGHLMHTFRNTQTGTSLLEEKLNHHFVRLDGKRGGYYFCMMTTIFSVGKCKLETVGTRHMPGGIQLLITLNDDLPLLDLGHDRIKQMKQTIESFLQGVAGDAVPAPWENFTAASSSR